jgi:tRNA threonylcarbamoyladenosine biosynthesis protein TsaB
MNRLLAVETSAEACSAALLIDGETTVFFEHSPMRHADLLLPAISGLLDEAGIGLAHLDAIVFGRGPGSFTSLRIGIGVVQGLAWGADIPVVPLSSLAAVAQDASDASASGAESICVAVDARMNEVYTANFRRGDNGIVIAESAERVCSPQEVNSTDEKFFIAAGNGFERFSELNTLGSTAAECFPAAVPRAETLCRLAIDWLSGNLPLQAGLAQPVYVRNKVASKPTSG